MSRPRLVLIHGAATTARIWRRMLPHLTDYEVVCPDRPCSGDLDTEVAALAEPCTDAVIAGVSGGATLGLELAARGVPFRAAVLHEPAAGSLAPGLLAHVAEGLRTSGVTGFGRALYGPEWTEADAPTEPGVVDREFAMFRAFEPTPPPRDCGPVLLTVGAHSPPPRHASVTALGHHCNLPWTTIPGTSHAAHLESPQAFATTIRTHAHTNQADAPQ
ncbi:alpha/beta fold hydrolase [Streptomyces endophyticus]|uniref:Alpha/beta hydrolase n=1 Tax=Streptomyces endophyticus TaxID=714166 RepID=A0ABU6F5H5_9ACTN|nr:alpha/beta hydrolase [Streptomyces endophyticus]MEB8338082.1 alpha/beta hydrolase [Streptomyces endophyticus]